jgi:uncharacterized membrane protein YkgB
MSTHFINPSLAADEASAARTASAGTAADILEHAGIGLARYGLVAILLLIGGIKFTPYEAEAIQPLVAHSPLLFWLYGVLDVRQVAAVFGAFEILAGLLIATRPFAPRLSAVGSVMCVPIFLTTLSFMLSTPGVWQPGYGFPALSATGAFLVKDIVLLGAASWTGAEALRKAFA